ncbi:MAG: START-like domain-containing protein [Arachidicoccus sp.]|nr:START-like domain-containing protein [Arachidicoccus sp.]
MAKKQLYTLEFPVRSSPNILYSFLATPAGLQEWFADEVDQRDGVYSFSWGSGAPEKAKLVDSEENVFVRFSWLNEDPKEYFEFRIEKAEVSNQTILTISAFAEKNDVKDESRVWEYQIKELFHRIGS